MELATTRLHRFHSFPHFLLTSHKAKAICNALLSINLSSHNLIKTKIENKGMYTGSTPLLTCPSHLTKPKPLEMLYCQANLVAIS